MKRSLKKAIAFTLAFALALQLVVFTAPSKAVFAAGLSDFEIAEYDDGTFCVTGYTGKAKDVVIPSNAGISAVYIYGDNKMKTLTVPEGVEGLVISSDTLEKLVLPSTLAEMYVSYCPSLKEIDGSKIKSIEDNYGYEVYACPVLEKFNPGKMAGSLYVSLLDGIKSIDFSGSTLSYLFLGYSENLKDIKLNKDLRSVSLYRLPGLQNVTIPKDTMVELFDVDFDKVTIKNNSYGFYIKDGGLYRDYYDEYVGANVKYLEAIDFNRKVINVDEGTEVIKKLNLSGNAYNTEVINLPDSVEMFDWYAFDGGDKLKEFSFPKNLISIYGYSFSGFNPDIALEVPASVTYLSYDAFTDFKGKVTIEKETPNLSEYKGGVYYNYLYSDGEKISTWLVYYPSDKTKSEFIDGLTHIGQNVFRNSSIKSLVIPEGVRWLELNLNHAYNLTSISIPSTVDTIYTPMMIYAPALKKVTVSSNNEYYSSYKNCLYNKDLTALVDVPGALEEIVIPEGVLSLNYYTVTTHYVEEVNNDEISYRYIEPKVTFPSTIEEFDYYSLSFGKASVCADSLLAGYLQSQNNDYAESAAEYGYEPYAYNYTLKDSVKNLLKMIYVVDSVSVSKGKTAEVTVEMPLGLNVVNKLSAGNNTECQVKFSSSNKKIAKVDANTGVVKGVKKGTCTINVKCTIDNGKKKTSKTFKVKVKVK